VCALCMTASVFMVMHKVAASTACLALQTFAGMQGTKVSVAGVRAELEALHAKFKDRHRYLLKVLTAKTLKISWQSELHYLVMRINFNDFHGKSDDLY